MNCPVEILQLIVDQLDHRSYYRLSATCKYYQNVLLSTQFIKHRLNLFFIINDVLKDLSLYDRLKQLSIVSGNINIAIDNDFRSIVSYLVVLYTTPVMKDPKSFHQPCINKHNINRLIEYNYYDELVYLHNKGLNFTDYMAIMAAQKGHLDMLIYMENNGLPIQNYIIDEAAGCGHLHILEHYDTMVSATAYGAKKAINNNHQEIVEFLNERGIIAIPTKRKLFF